MPPSQWLPTDRTVRWLLVPCLAFMALASNHAYLADFWHHLARGRAIVQSATLLDHDIFTYTVADQPFQDVNGLSQVFYYALYSRGGLGLVRVVNALFVAGTFVWLMALCKRRSGSLEAGLAVSIATFLGLWELLTIRPQTFSMLLFVSLYDVLDRALRQPRWLFLAPLILALWANLHGAFPAGLLLIAAFTAGAFVERHRPWEWLAGLVASLLATFVNPYGVGIYRYVGLTSNVAAKRGIDEWLPPSFDSLAGILFFASLPLVFGLVLAFWKKKTPSVRDMLILLGFAILAARSIRMVAWWWLGLAPILADRIALFFSSPSPEADKPNRGAALTSLVLLYLAFTSIPGLQKLNPLLAFRPVQPEFRNLQEAERYIEDHHLGGNLFSRYEWGEYLAWELWPRCKIFMDGRIEIYPDAVWDEYSAITLGQADWQDLLDRHRVEILLLDAEFHGKRLLPKVEASPGWEKKFQAGDAVVFFRKGPG